MQLSGIYIGLGQDALAHLLRSISLGKLRTYQLFDRVKTRLHLAKLNQENLRKAAPRLWARLADGDQELAADLSQAILVSHLPVIVSVLDFLGVPHNEGFFDKDADVSARLSGDWQQRSFDQFRARFPEPVLLFYLNHLAHEVGQDAAIFLPAEVR